MHSRKIASLGIGYRVYTAMRNSTPLTGDKLGHTWYLVPAPGMQKQWLEFYRNHEMSVKHSLPHLIGT